MSFIHIRVLILQRFSLFLICEFFNIIINHTRIYIYIFYSSFHLYGYRLLHITTLSSPFLLSSSFGFLSLSSRQRSPPWECDRSHSLPCCIAFARGHRKTAENLYRYSRPLNRVCPQSTVSEKMTFRSAFQYAGCGPEVTHPSTDPAPSCLT